MRPGESCPMWAIRDIVLDRYMGPPLASEAEARILASANANGTFMAVPVMVTMQPLPSVPFHITQALLFGAS